MASSYPILPAGFAHLQDGNLKAIICDMDGLLLDTEAVSWDTFCAASRAVSHEPDEILFAQLTGLSGPAHRPILIATLPAHIDAIAFDADWKQRYHQMLSEHAPPKPQAAAFLQAVRHAGIRLSVATSSQTSKAENNLEKAGFLSFFEHITGGDQVAIAKPAPDIYVRALQKLGLGPENCLVFEDSNNGVRAAQAAGLAVIQVPDLQKPSDDLMAEGYLSVPSLQSALSILKIGSGSPE